MKCNTLRMAAVAAALVSLSALAQSSQAVPTVYTDRDDSTTFMTSFPNSLAKFNEFTASLTSFGVNDIETVAGFNPTLAFSGTQILAFAQGVLAQNAPGFQIGSQALLELDAVGFPQVNTAFSFNTQITSFGLYVTQGGDAASNPITFRLTNSFTNSTVDVPVQVGPGWGTDNTMFVGISDAALFDKVELIETGDIGDGMLYDNVVAGGAVPEPGSLLLAMIGGAFALCRGGRGRRG